MNDFIIILKLILYNNEYLELQKLVISINRI